MLGTKSIQVLRRQVNGTYAAPETIDGCLIAQREVVESPVPVWPPVTSGRTVYAPAGVSVLQRDRAIVDAVTYEADGDSFQWDAIPGTPMGVVIQLRRTDNWFDTTLEVRTYLGSYGFGDSWADAVDWPANIVDVRRLSSDSTSDYVQAQVVVRVPPVFESQVAVDKFPPGSLLVVAGATSTVATVQPVTRDGVAEYVEVTGR